MAKGIGHKLRGCPSPCRQRCVSAAQGMRPNVGDSSQAAHLVNVVIHEVPRDGRLGKSWQSIPQYLRYLNQPHASLGLGNINAQDAPIVVNGPWTQRHDLGSLAASD